MRDLTIEQIVDYLVENRRVPGAQPLAWILDELSWALDPESVGALLEIQRRWLREGDFGQAEIALAMDTVHPFRTLAETKAVLERVATRWPELRAQCEQQIRSRAEVADQPEGDAQRHLESSKESGDEEQVQMNQVVEFLIEHRAPQLHAEHLAEILDELVRTLNEEAANALVVLQERWLLDDDRYRARITLGMRSVHPFPTRAEMAIALDAVAARWPELRSMCDEKLASRAPG